MGRASLSFDVAISDLAMALCSSATLELITQDAIMSISKLIYILKEVISLKTLTKIKLCPHGITKCFIY